MIEQAKHYFIGSYTSKEKQPSLYQIDLKKPTIYQIGVNLLNPSFVVCHNNLVYLVEEHDMGSLSVFSYEYLEMKKISTQGKDPCHISFHPSSNYLSVTNYSGGSFIVYKLKDKLPEEVLYFGEHEGSSVNTDRQLSPHPHSSIFSRDGKILFVADLGTDIVYYYRFEDQNVELEKEKSVKITGCGPRHLTHGNENEKVLYLAGELDSTIRVLSYEKNELEMIRAYKISENPSNFPSEIAYKNSMVYLASRGDDCISVFQEKKEEEGLILNEKKRFKVGSWPRHFKVENSGVIYVACQYENLVQRFKWEGQNEIVQLSSFSIHAPSCIAFEE